MTDEVDVSFSFLAENTSDVVCRAGLDMTLRYVSPSAGDVLGWHPAEMAGRSLHSFVAAEEAANLAAASQASVLEKVPVTLRVQKKDGAFLSMEIRRRLLLDSVTGEPMEYVVLMRSVEHLDWRPDEAKPAVLAQRVAGLSTHAEFLEDLERECSRASRDQSSVSVLRLDFNGFRQFHFLDGHRVGDECLTKAAAAVKEALRLTDFAAQFLTEDIVVLLPSTDARGAARVAAKVRAAINLLRPPRSFEGQTWTAVSIGIATATARSAGGQRIPEILLLSAEHALYKAQQQEAESLRSIAAYSARLADWKKSMPGAPPRCA